MEVPDLPFESLQSYCFNYNKDFGECQDIFVAGSPNPNISDMFTVLLIVTHIKNELVA